MKLLKFKIESEIVFFAIISVLAIVGVASMLSAPTDDCRKYTPREMQVLIEKDIRRKNEDPRWLRGPSSVKFFPDSLNVRLPVLSDKSVGYTGIDWNTKVEGVSMKDGKKYMHIIYLSCGRGLDYSAATDQVW